MALQRPHLPPHHLDLDRLLDLISATRVEQEDHVWLLRENPSYFASIIKNWGEHRTELVTDSRGQLDPLCKDSQSWKSSTHFVLSQSAGGLYFWSIVKMHFEDLAKEYRKVVNLDEFCRLPRELEHQFRL